MKGPDREPGLTHAGVRFAATGLLAGLSESSLTMLAAACKWESYAAGEYLLYAQDGGDDVLFIQSGRVRTSVCSPSGKDVVYRELTSGACIGDYAAIDGLPRSADVVAIVTTRVGRMPAQEFLRVLSREPNLMQAQMRALTANIRDMTDRLYQVATLSVAGRIQAYLLRCAPRSAAVAADGLSAAFPLSKQAEIAAHVVTHREAVSRELGRLEKAGILIRESGRVRIHLDRLAGEIAES